jgi:hypothetical protein
VNFQLNWDDYLLLPGQDGEWDAGMVFGPEFLDMGSGDRMCLYYGSLGIDHRVPDGSPRQIGGIGRAWLRKDGFASISGGTIETCPLTVNAGKIALNMKGGVKITVKTPEGAILASGEARGDHRRIIPQIDITAFTGCQVVLSIDLTAGELFGVSL